MSERIFNLFLEIKDNVIFELAAVAHDRGGSDEKKLAFLQDRVGADAKSAKRFSIPKRYQVIDAENGHRTSSLTYASYITLSEVGKHLEIFEEIFEELKGPENPLFVITPIVDGNPQTGVQEYL